MHRRPVRKRQVVINGQSAHLTPTEFKLLTILATNAEKVVRIEKLLLAIWGHEYKDLYHYLG